MKPVKITLDTDMGSDCDDTAALAILHELVKEGKCELLAVTHCCQGKYFAGCIDAINRYYGSPDIPVGVFSPDSGAPGMEDFYAEYACTSFPNRFRDDMGCPDTVQVLRKALANEGDGEVTIAVIGSLYSMMRLMKSGPDAMSDLSGMELIQKKVARTVVMGGRFFENWPDSVLSPKGYVLSAEYNIRCAIPAAQAVCSDWPGELIFCSFEIGCKLCTGGRLQKEGYPVNPVSGCYRVWHENTGTPGSGRESWDPATVLFAVCPDMGLWKMYPWGRISVDDAGVTTWRHEPDGRHTFLTECAPAQEAQRAIDEILERDLKRIRC